jgi:Zn-dependent protease with chaperone function
VYKNNERWSKAAMDFLGPTLLIVIGIIFSLLFVFFIKKISRKQEERADQFEQEVLASDWSKSSRKNK